MLSYFHRMHHKEPCQHYPGSSTLLWAHHPPHAGILGHLARLLYIFKPLSVHGWTSAFLLDVHRLRGAIEGRLSHFYHAGSGRLGRMWSSREKSPKLLQGLKPATERTESEIPSFCHWANTTLATERTDGEIHSFSRWAVMTRAMERIDSEIHSFSHWAIMTELPNTSYINSALNGHRRITLWVVNVA